MLSKKFLSLLLLLGLVACDSNQLSSPVSSNENSTPSSDVSSNSSENSSSVESSSSSFIESSDSSDSSLPEVISAITINNKIDTLVQEQTHKLSISVEPASLASTVEFKSSLPSCASINNEGLITALLPGTATISVLSPDHSVSDSFTLIVSKKVIPVESVSITNSETEMIETTTLQLNVDVLPENATNKKVTYASSDINYATVSNEGLITAIKPTLENQPVVISVISEDNKEKKDEISLVIKRKIIGVSSISATLLSNEIIPNDIVKFDVEVLPENAENKEYTLSTTTPEILDIKDDVVTALKVGLGHLVFTANDNASISYTLDVNVLATSTYDDINDKLDAATVLEQSGVKNGQFSKVEGEETTLTSTWTVYQNSIMQTDVNGDETKKQLIYREEDILYRFADTISSNSYYDGVTLDDDEIGGWLYSEEEAAMELSLPSIDDSYENGLNNYIKDLLDDYYTYGSDEFLEVARIVVNVKDNQEIITISGGFETIDWYSDAKGYTELSMTIVFNDAHALVSFESTSIEADADNYDAEKQEIIDDEACEITVVSASLVYGSRVETDENKIKLDDYYVTSFDIDTSDLTDGNKLDLDKSIYVEATNEMPARHLEETYTVTCDKEDVIEVILGTYYGPSIKAVGVGEANITVTSAHGVSRTMKITVVVPPVKSISISYVPSTVTIGEKITDITATISPSGANQDYVIVLSDDSTELASLEKEEKSYTLTALQEGKVTIIAKSVEDETITDTETITIKKPINVDEIKATMCSKSYDDGYGNALTFNSDGTGSIAFQGDGLYNFTYELEVSGNMIYINILTVEMVSESQWYVLKPTTGSYKSSIVEDCSVVNVYVVDLDLTDYRDVYTTLQYREVTE